MSDDLGDRDDRFDTGPGYPREEAGPLARDDTDGQDHAHDHAHDHARHRRRRDRLIGAVAGGFRSHSHDHAGSIDDALLVSRQGTRALTVSLIGLLVTSAAQLAVFALSGSVGLLADTTHNFADALTAVPLGLAFVVARRPATLRYTYGYGRAEDLAGLAVVAVIAASAVIAAWQSIDRLVHPHAVTHLLLVAVAGVIGFAGNELAAWYRVRTGRRIGSAALVADGHHARADGFTSLAVVAGAIGVAAGWRLADPIVGLAITAAILVVLRSAARDIYRRLMDAVDPELMDYVKHQAGSVPAVQSVEAVRIRWVGHELHAELNITVDRDLTVSAGHDIAEAVHHHLLHEVRRLTSATVHVDPCSHDGNDPHLATAHHRPIPAEPHAAHDASPRTN